MDKKHLTLEQRVKIQEGLANRWKIRRIARYAGVSRSTVVREIKAYRYDKLEWACRFSGQNWCVKRDKCGVFGVCKGFGLREIPANEVIRTPALIPDIARQVLEKAKRIAEEEEITRKALERHRKSSGK